MNRRALSLILFLLGIILVLTVLLVGVTISFQSYRQASVKTMADYDGKISDLQDTLSEEQQAAEAEIEKRIPIETLKFYAAQYNVSADFLQRFFDDAIIYKDESGIVYAPIDDTLQKNDYDWFYLTRDEDGRLGYQDMTRTAKKEIDISKYQGNIDWKKAAADGVEFAIIRLGYRGYGSGELVFDEYFTQNMKGATKAGIPVGVYFFSQAISEAEAEEEAEMILDAIKKYDVQYPIVYDIEAVAEDARTADLDIKTRTDCAVAFCETVEQAGYRSMVYSNTGWLIGKLDFSRIEPYGIWLAQYYRTPFFPYKLDMWQYTSTGKVDGIKGDVDWNICFTDYLGEQESE